MWPDQRVQDGTEPGRAGRDRAPCTWGQAEGGDAELHRAGLVYLGVEDLVLERHRGGLLEVDLGAALVDDLVARLGAVDRGDGQGAGLGAVSREAQACVLGAAVLLDDGLDDVAGVVGKAEHGLSFR